MSRPQYEVTIMLEGDDETSPQMLEAAMRQLFKVAQRIPPDRRFNWRAPMIEVQPYSF